MQFIDLAAQQSLVRTEIDARIRAVLDHGNYILGPEIGELEQTLAAYVGAKHAISCASGTDALVLPLLAKGIGPGDVVFTTPFTFMATAEVISLLGAIPVFVDIDPVTFNMDPAHLEKAIEAVQKCDPTVYPLPSAVDLAGARMAAVIAVDLFGLPADYERIGSVCAQHNLFLIEDAAQSFGGSIHGRKAGSFGHVAATSFFPAKPLGCYGDGGMVFTDDDDLADIMLSLRVHGKGEDKYDNKRIGLNARMDTLQAAIMLAKWPLFESEVEHRQEAARRYTALLAERARSIITPTVPEGYVSGWAQYTIRCGNKREDIRQHLASNGVPTAVYYPLPLHLQTAYSPLSYSQGDFPISEQASVEVLSLPFGPYLKDSDMDIVIGCFESL